MGAVWSALLVGGGLAGALLAWLLRDPGKGYAGMEPGEAPGCPLSPAPSRRQLDTKPDHLRGCSECLGSGFRGSAELQSCSGEDYEMPNVCVPSGWSPGADSLTLEVGATQSFLDISRSGKPDSSLGKWEFYEGRETFAKAAPCFIEKLPNALVDRAEMASLDSQELADTEDWEVVSWHSSWGELNLGSSLEALVGSPNEGVDYGRVFMETNVQADEGKAERVAAVCSESLRVRVRFQTHYIPSTDTQAVAVTGGHKSLGNWDTYVPLHYHQNGLWSRSMSLPADTGVEWKFVVLENGCVTRWEECSNRFLETGSEDRVVHKWWGIH